MTLINIFVKLWNNLVSICNNCKRVVIELLQTILKCNYAYFNLNMDKWLPINGT